VHIQQDANLYAALLDGAERAEFTQREGRRTYVHVVRGSLTVGGQPLAAGDALKSVGAASITLENARDAEVLLFDLP